MKKTSIPAMVIFCFLISIPSIGLAQENDKLQFGVRVMIQGGGDLREIITSYINRELRSRGDVVIVDENEGFVMKILALEIKSMGGYPHGVSLTVVGLMPYNIESIVGLLVNEKDKEKYKELVRNMTPQLYEFVFYRARVCPTAQLEQTCQEMIAAFDSEVLEPRREIWRAFMMPPK
jgi:hypothetical protein